MDIEDGFNWASELHYAKFGHNTTMHETKQLGWYLQALNLWLFRYDFLKCGNPKVSWMFFGGEGIWGKVVSAKFFLLMLRWRLLAVPEQLTSWLPVVALMVEASLQFVFSWEGVWSTGPSTVAYTARKRSRFKDYAHAIRYKGILFLSGLTLRQAFFGHSKKNSRRKKIELKLKTQFFGIFKMYFL